MEHSPRWSVAKTSIVTALTVAAFLGTMLIRFPIPATGGYSNVGDVFVVFAGLWLGPLAGLIVGAVGPTGADAVGYPQFILATSVTKGLEGLLVGLIAYRAKSDARRFVAAVVGGTTIVLGYFVFEALIYPALGKTIPLFAITTVQQAIAELVPNSVQGIVAVIIGLGLFKAVNARPERPPSGPSVSNGSRNI